MDVRGAVWCPVVARLLNRTVRSGDVHLNNRQSTVAGGPSERVLLTPSGETALAALESAYLGSGANRSRVYLMRHGQTVFNAINDRTGRDPIAYDARLSAVGIQQAVAAREAVARIAPELVVTTPATRALETVVHAFPDRDSGVLVQALHRERVTNSCDIGSSPEELAERFPQFDFGDLESVWWWHDGEPDERGVVREPLGALKDRVAAFQQWLRQRPERSIVVVGHAEFFSYLVGRIMSNCELGEWPDDEGNG